MGGCVRVRSCACTCKLVEIFQLYTVGIQGGAFHHRLRASRRHPGGCVAGSRTINPDRVICVLGEKVSLLPQQPGVL